MDDEFIKIKNRINDIKSLLENDMKSRDDEVRRRLLEELDRLSYKCFKVLIEQMRDLDGNGDGI